MAQLIENLEQLTNDMLGQARFIVCSGQNHTQTLQLSEAAWELLTNPLAVNYPEAYEHKIDVQKEIIKITSRKYKHRKFVILTFSDEVVNTLC